MNANHSMPRRERINRALREYEDPDLAATRRERINRALRECEEMDRSESINSAARFDNDHDLVASRTDMLSTPLAPVVSLWDLERNRLAEESRREWINRTAPRPAPAAPAAAAAPINPATIGRAAAAPKLPAHLSAAATGAADDDAAFWAENARGQLPAPFGEWAACAIERCGRTKKSAKLIPGAPACEALERMGQSSEWAVLQPTRQSLVISLLVDGAGLFPGVVTAALGRPGKPPPPLPVADADNEPDTLADMGAVEAARVVAAGMLFAGRQGLIHGPAGGGKSTVLANVIARVTTGRPWLGVPTVAGAVVVVCEEAATWAHTVKAAGGDLRRVYLRRWPDLTAAVEKLRPVAVIVDTLQYVAHATGSAELDSAQAVDGILRPLERLCRKYGCAVAVTDHEPWADPSAGGSRDRESGTQKRPRHSGAKVATADYLLRVSTADGVTTISRGAKVRWGIAIEPAVSVDIRGERVSVPAGTAVDDSRRKVQGMDGSTTVTDIETYDRLIGFLTQHPNASKREIRDGLKMRGRSAGELDRAIDQAVAAGRVERKSGPRNSTLHRVVPQSEPSPPGTGSDPTHPEPVPVNGNMDGTTPGTGSDPIGNHSSGTGSGTTQAEPLSETKHADTDQPEHGTEHRDPRRLDAVGGAQAGGELAGSTPGPADPRAGSTGPPDDSAQCDPTGGSGAAPRTIGAGPPDRPAEIPKPPPPVPPAEPPAETASSEPDRHNAILAAAEKLFGAADMKTAARQHVREQAGKDRCRLCGGPPPLELTGPAALALCGGCAATHREMTATTPAELSARVDQHVGGRSLDELWSGAQETAAKLLQDDPDLRRLALADPELRRFVH